MVPIFAPTPRLSIQLFRLRSTLIVEGGLSFLFLVLSMLCQYLFTLEFSWTVQMLSGVALRS